MNREMQEVLENLDRFISKRGFAYALLMAQIEDVSIDIDLIVQRNNQKRLPPQRHSQPRRKRQK